jgi:hypothetical protein
VIKSLYKVGIYKHVFAAPAWRLAFAYIDELYIAAWDGLAAITITS